MLSLERRVLLLRVAFLSGLMIHSGMVVDMIAQNLRARCDDEFSLQYQLTAIDDVVLELFIFRELMTKSSKRDFYWSDGLHNYSTSLEGSRVLSIPRI